VAVDELADVARQYGDEEETCCKAEQAAALSNDDQCRTERDLDEPRQDHDDILVDPQPIGYLRLKVDARKRQVAESGEDECSTQDEPSSPANAIESSGGHRFDVNPILASTECLNEAAGNLNSRLSPAAFVGTQHAGGKANGRSNIALGSSGFHPQLPHCGSGDHADMLTNSLFFMSGFVQLPHSGWPIEFSDPVSKTKGPKYLGRGQLFSMANL